MRKCPVGKYATRQINRLWIRPDVRRRTGPTTVEPNVLWQLVLRRARSAPSKYFSRYVITCHLAKSSIFFLAYRMELEPITRPFTFSTLITEIVVDYLFAFPPLIFIFSFIFLLYSANPSAIST